MDLHDDVPQDWVPALRRGAYTFMRRYAASAWGFLQERDGWKVNMPPEVQALPAPERFTVHARREANRLAEAHLYALSPAVSAYAVTLGARYRCATALARNCSDVFDPFYATPPARHGFVVWQDPGGVGYGGLGAPILACHWGPHPSGGHWVAWWSDNHAMTKVWEADAHADGGTWLLEYGQDWLTFTGALFYDDQLLIGPAPPTRHLPLPTSHDDAQQPDPGRLALLYTTMATWELLHEAGTVELTSLAMPPRQATADRKIGLRPRPITHVTIPAS